MSKVILGPLTYLILKDREIYEQLVYKSLTFFGSTYMACELLLTLLWPETYDIAIVCFNSKVPFITCFCRQFVWHKAYLPTCENFWQLFMIWLIIYIIDSVINRKKVSDKNQV